MKTILGLICVVSTSAVLIFGTLYFSTQNNTDLPEVEDNLQLPDDSNSNNNNDNDNNTNNDSDNNNDTNSDDTLKEESIVFSFGSNLVFTESSKKTYYSTNSVVVVDGANVVYVTENGTYKTDKTKELLGAYDLIYTGLSTMHEYGIEDLTSILKEDQRIGTTFSLDGNTYIIEGAWQNALDVSCNGVTFTVTNGTQPNKYNLLSLEDYANLEDLEYVGDFVIDTTYAYTIINDDVVEEKIFYDSTTKYYFQEFYNSNSVRTGGSLYTYAATYEMLDINNGLSYSDSFVFTSNSTDGYSSLSELSTLLKQMINNEFTYFIFEGVLYEFVSENSKGFTISFTKNFVTRTLLISNDSYGDYSVVTEEEETQREASITFAFSTSSTGTTKIAYDGVTSYYTPTTQLVVEGSNMTYYDEYGTFRNYDLDYIFAGELVFASSEIINFTYINDIKRIISHDQRIGTTFTLNGQTYEIVSVSSTKVDLLVDGKTMTINKYSYSGDSYTVVSEEWYKKRVMYDGMADKQINYLEYFQAKIDTLGHMNGTSSENFFSRYDSSSLSLSASNSAWTFLNYLDTSNVTSMQYTFNGCYNITYMPLLDTSNVTDMKYAFYDCRKLTALPLFDTSKVTSFERTFYKCETLEEIPFFDTSSATTFSYAFLFCYKIKTIPLLDMSNVTSLSHAFYSCVSLESVPLLDMSSMLELDGTFYGCILLETVPLFDTSTVKTMSSMFQNATGLTHCPDFNSSNTTNFASMFSGATGLLVRPNLDISNATSTLRMYENCPAV